MAVRCPRALSARLARCQPFGESARFPPMQEAVMANTIEQDNSAQIEYWNDRAAVTWTALQDRLDAMFMPLTARAIDAAAPVAGEHVLDVGCGCGATVLQLAQRVGPGGSVLGVDVSAPMAA